MHLDFRDIGGVRPGGGVKKTTTPPSQSSQNNLNRPITGIASPPPVIPETGLEEHIANKTPDTRLQKLKPSAEKYAPLLEKSETFYKKRWEEKGVMRRIGKFFNKNIARNKKDHEAARALPKPPNFNTKHVLNSISDRALEDMGDFSSSIWRLMSLPLGAVAAIKTYRLSRSSKAEAQVPIHPTPREEKLAKYAEINAKIDQLVTEAEEAYEKQDLKAVAKYEPKVTALSKELLKLDKELDALAKKEGLKYSPKPESIKKAEALNAVAAVKKVEFKERLNALKMTAKWYFAQVLGIVAFILRKIKVTPIIGGLASILAYVADTLKAYLKGSPKSDEFKVLMQRYDNRKTANKVLKELEADPDGNKEIKLIAKNIARNQNVKSKGLMYGKQIVDLVGFGASIAGAVVGAIGLITGGALAPIIAAIFLHVSVGIAVVAATIGAVYLLQRFIGWGVKLGQLARLEHKFHKATDPEEKLKIASRALKKDGKKASFFLVKILQEENDSQLNKKEPRKKLSGPVREFIEKFDVLNKDEWNLLDHLADDNIQDAARMLGKKLYIY